MSFGFIRLIIFVALTKAWRLRWLLTAPLAIWGAIALFFDHRRYNAPSARSQAARQGHAGAQALAALVAWRAVET